MEDRDTEHYKAFLVAASNITSHEDDNVYFKQLKEILSKEDVNRIAQDGWSSDIESFYKTKSKNHQSITYGWPHCNTLWKIDRNYSEFLLSNYQAKGK